MLFIFLMLNVCQHLEMALFSRSDQTDRGLGDGPADREVTRDARDGNGEGPNESKSHKLSE
jgi:hypothetical protein